MNSQIESIPKLVPISDMRIHQNALLAQMAEGPVVLTQRGRAAAVLVEPGLWNELVERLGELQDTVDALRGRQERAADPTAARSWEDVRAELMARAPQGD